MWFSKLNVHAKNSYKSNKNMHGTSVSDNAVYVHLQDTSGLLPKYCLFTFVIPVHRSQTVVSVLMKIISFKADLVTSEPMACWELISARKL